MTALSHRDQLATLAPLHGWVSEAYVTEWGQPADTDRYRRADVVVTVSFTPTGRIRNADRMVDGAEPADCELVEPRGKIGQVSSWLRHSDAAYVAIVEAAQANGWEIHERGDMPLALTRGALDTRENAPSAAEQDSTEGVTVVFAVDGAVLYAAAKGWDRNPGNTSDDALAAILDRLTWAHPSRRCAVCGKPEHRHHLGELGEQHPYADLAQQSAPVGMHDPESPDFDPDVRDQDVERIDAALAATDRRAAAQRRAARASSEPGAGPAAVFNADRDRVVEVYRDGRLIWRADGGPLPSEVDDARVAAIAAVDGGPLDLDAVADQAAGSIATLVGVARPDFADDAQREGATLARLVRELRREVDAHRARAASYRAQLAARTDQRDQARRQWDDAAVAWAETRDDLAAAHQRLGEQGRQLAATVRELRAATASTAATGAAERAADAAGRQLAGGAVTTDLALLSGDVSPRQLVEAMAQGDYVELSPAEHGKPGDQLVRIGWASRGRRIAGYLVGDDLLVTRLGEHGGVPAAGVAVYLAQVAKRSDIPTSSTRVEIARKVRQLVEAARRTARTAGTAKS